MGLVSFYALIQMELEQRLGRIEEAQEQIVAVRMCNGSSHSMEQYGAVWSKSEKNCNRSKRTSWCVL